MLYILYLTIHLFYIPYIIYIDDSLAFGVNMPFRTCVFCGEMDGSLTPLMAQQVFIYVIYSMTHILRIIHAYIHRSIITYSIIHTYVHRSILRYNIQHIITHK